MKNFILIGAAGYIAPRHMQAIKATGNNLLAVLDPHDSVGVLDSYFPQADFFTEFERFDRHCDKLIRSGTSIDYLVVCSPNYLHDAHIRFGLRIGADVICEKPVVLNPWNVDALLEMEKETGKRVYTIMQLRLHPAILALRKKVMSEPDKKHNIEIKYISSRGHWYQHSWKGDVNKSGGIITNIGLHFFDMLIWLFGSVKSSKVINQSSEKASGELELERASAKWLLSIDKADLPEGHQEPTFRSLIINGEQVDFSSGFQDLHIRSYEQILAGNGIELCDNKPVISLVAGMRQQ